MPTSETKEKLLFSEDQVDVLVEAKLARKLTEDKLADATPQTITITRKTAIEKLKDIEKEIIKKHGQAVIAWKKAYRLYADHIQKNPGSKAVNEPKDEPKLGGGIENVKAWIRALEVVPEEKIKISRSEWIQIFKDAGMAIATMRAERDKYIMFVSGAGVSNLNSNSSFSINTTG